MSGGNGIHTTVPIRNVRVDRLKEGDVVIQGNLRWTVQSLQSIQGTTGKRLVRVRYRSPTGIERSMTKPIGITVPVQDLPEES